MHLGPPQSLTSAPSFFALPQNPKLLSKPSTSQLMEKQRLMKALQIRRQQMESLAQAHALAGEQEVVAADEGHAHKADSGVDVESEDDQGTHIDSPPAADVPEAEDRPMPVSLPALAQLELPADSVESLPFEEPEKPEATAHDASSVHDIMATAGLAPSPLRTPPRLQTTSKKEKRKALMDPLRTCLVPDDSEIDSLADESLLEELDSAEVQEATPISISQSPVMAVFPGAIGERKPSIAVHSPKPSLNLHSPNASVQTHSRQKSNQLDSAKSEASSISPLESSEPPPIRTRRRSQEKAYLEALGEGDDPLLGRSTTVKRNLSLGISRRIQTLVDISRRQPKRTTSATVTDLETSGPFLITRADSFRASPRDTGGAQVRPNTGDGSSRPAAIDMTHNRGGLKKSHTVSYPDRHRPRDLKSRHQGLENPSNESSGGKRSSIIYSSAYRHSTYVPQDVINCPAALTNGHVNHDIGSNGVVEHESHDSDETAHAKDSNETERPTRRRRGSEVTRDPVDNAPEVFDGNVLASGDELRSPSTLERRTSKANRLFKRLSTISASQRGFISPEPTWTESRADVEPPPITRQELSRTTSQASVVGDLNVLFPDSQIWRRHWVEVDKLGNLLFSNPDAYKVSMQHPKHWREPMIPKTDI